MFNETKALHFFIFVPTDLQRLGLDDGLVVSGHDGEALVALVRQLILVRLRLAVQHVGHLETRDQRERLAHAHAERRVGQGEQLKAETNLRGKK